MLLATDLDGTFLGGRQSDRMRLYRFLPRQPEVTLVFVTGRGFEHVVPLIYDPTIPTPKYVICDVGTTIVHGDTLEPVQPIQSDINQAWPGEPAVLEAIEGIDGLERQEVPQQRQEAERNEHVMDVHSSRRWPMREGEERRGSTVVTRTTEQPGCPETRSGTEVLCADDDPAVAAIAARGGRIPASAGCGGKINTPLTHHSPALTHSHHSPLPSLHLAVGRALVSDAVRTACD